MITIKDLESLVRDNYSLGEDIRIDLIRSRDNDNYLLQAGERRFVLRVYRYQKHWLTRESDYLFELHWLTFLRASGLPVSYPIPRRDGRFLNTLDAPEGNRYWAIFSFVEGRKGLTPEQAYLFGRSIAQIHLVSNNFKPAYLRFTADLDWLLDQSIERLKNFLHDEHRHIYYYLCNTAESLYQTIAALPFSGDEFGLIGGDFHGDNHHVTPAGTILHFDFDLCSYGWRAYDLAVFRSVRGRSNRLWHNALAGYESLRPLSPHERSAIPAFVLIRHIWVMGSVTTYPEAPHLLETGLWTQWFEKYKKYESGDYITD